MRRAKAVPTGGGEVEFDFDRSLQKLTPDSFFQFIRAYPHPEGVSVYVYRVEPVIDRRLAGLKDSNIDIISGATIDEDYLLRSHGSGRYHLKFSDANKPRNLTEVAKTTIDIKDPRVPPQLNPVELDVTARGNERIVQQYISEGWTVIDGKLTAPAVPESGAAALAGVVKDLIAKQGAPVPAPPAPDQLAQLRGTMGLLKEFGLGQASGGDAVQVELIRTLGNLATRAAAAEPASPVDPLAQLRNTHSLLKELGLVSAPAAPVEAAPRPLSFLDALVALPGILQYGAEMMKQLAFMRAAEPGKVVNIATGTAPGSPGLAAAPVEAAGPGTEGPMGLFAGVDLAGLKTVADDAIDAFKRGVTGSDFAHGVCCGRRNGEKLYGVLCQMVESEEQPVQLILSLAPQLAAELAPRAAEIEAFLASFVAYGEQQAPPAPAAAEPEKKAGKKKAA